jgi:hypothetical protein
MTHTSRQKGLTEGQRAALDRSPSGQHAANMARVQAIQDRRAKRLANPTGPTIGPGRLGGANVINRDAGSDAD